MIMHSQTSISILVLAVFSSSNVLSDDMSETQKSELANKLNTLVRHPGWRYMDNVKIILNHNNRRQFSDPMPEIFEAISSNRNPVNESNVLVRYKEIWNVLMCKYAEIVFEYKIHVNSLIRECRREKRMCLRYYECFHSLLNKLDNMAARFKCMRDALDLIYSLRPQSGDKHGVMIAMEKLTEYTLTLQQRTLSKLSQRGINVDAVDLEVQIITDYINMLLRKNIHWYSNNYCIISTHSEWTVQRLNQDFEYKKSNRLIPQEMTMLRYIENEIDCYVGGILASWFDNLGFAYDVAGNVTIGIN